MTAILLDILLLIAGLAILLLGGDWLVRGAVALAKKSGIPALIIGLTVVAFGTSAPEMVVSAVAALSNAPGLAIGNIVGSNIANTFLVLGIPALIAPLATQATGVRRNALIALGATCLFIGLTWDRVLSLSDGIILIAGIAGYIAWLGWTAFKAKADPAVAEMADIEHMDAVPISPLKIALCLVGGVIALPLGANLIVEGGTGLADVLGVPEAVVGLTVLALGTSLPELATSLVAAMRRQVDMAIGNVIGSNIFNLFAVGGITGITAGAALGGAPVDGEFFRLDYWVMLAAAGVIAGLALSRRALGRAAGGVLFAAYCAYIAALGIMNLT
jgi:cation:H+ antiporter